MIKFALLLLLFLQITHSQDKYLLVKVDKNNNNDGDENVEESVMNRMNRKGSAESGPKGGLKEASEFEPKGERSLPNSKGKAPEKDRPKGGPDDGFEPKSEFRPKGSKGKESRSGGKGNKAKGLRGYHYYRWCWNGWRWVSCYYCYDYYGNYICY